MLITYSAEILVKVSVKLDTLTSRGGECYKPNSLWPTPHEPLNTNPLIESLAECARADAIVHGWCSQCVHAEIRLFTKYGHQHEQN